MQKWEYKTLFRDRSDQKLSYQWNIDIPAQLETLGKEGWELVCISPRTGGSYSARTDEELWVFKRPML